MSWFNFKKTGSASLGVGVSDLAFLRPQTLPLVSNYGAGFVPRHSINALSMTPYGYAMPSTVKVGLRGNGSYVSGQLQLSPLTDFQKKRQGG